MKKKNGFTLIELLVVISIIALLLSIMLPALGKVKGKARSLVCKANLRTLCMGMKLYAEENHGKSMEMTFGAVGEYWFDQLMPYLGQATGQYDVKEQLQVGFCPSTQRPPSANTHASGTAKLSWRWMMSVGSKWKSSEGSYGLNHWLTPGYYGIETKESWSQQYTTLPGSVPSLGDCNWVGGWPTIADRGPKTTSGTASYLISEGKNPFVGEDQLGRYCLDRHDMRVNIGFVGGNVETIPLEKLWTLRWNKSFAPVDVNITKD